MSDPDRLAEIKAGLARAREQRRFYGPRSAAADIDWLIMEVERLRDVVVRLEGELAQEFLVSGEDYPSEAFPPST